MPLQHGLPVPTGERIGVVRYVLGRAARHAAAADLAAADPAATARFRLVRRIGYEDFKTRLS